MRHTGESSSETSPYEVQSSLTSEPHGTKQYAEQTPEVSQLMRPESQSDMEELRMAMQMAGMPVRTLIHWLTRGARMETASAGTGTDTSPPVYEA